MILRTKTTLAVLITILVTGCANEPKNDAIIANVSEDGNVISIDGSNIPNAETEEIDEEMTIATENVETYGKIEDVKEIRFDEKNIDVKLLPSSSDDIEVKVSGTARKGANIKIVPDLLNNLLYIYVKGDLTNSNLSCSIGIPKKEFKDLWVLTKNGNISAIGNGDINIDMITLESENGDIDCDLFSELLTVVTENGCITSNINVLSNSRLSYSSQNGNINLGLQNVKVFDTSVNTDKGKVSNQFNPNGEYTVEGRIETTNGNIRIH